MKEFIEKLIGRLEEHKTKAYVTGFTNNPYELGACHAMDDAVKIVNQLAEEYNNGWISVDDRLPENISTVILQVKEIEKPTIGWYGNIEGWRLTEKDFVDLKEFTVLAWQPLPEPFKPIAE